MTETTKRITFPVGYFDFHEDVRINATLNMYYSTGVFDREELEDIGKKIDSFETWISVFSDLAEKYKEAGEILRAATCFRAAFFYCQDEDKKHILYESCRELYDDYYGQIPYIKYEHIPCRSYTIPVYSAVHDISKGVILLHGGYDSIIQDFLGIMMYLYETGYDVYFFEGDGQGEVLMRQGIRMRPEWEHCTKAVIDHYSLDDVTLIGISLGGYLAPRAAAYEKRISRVIMCDLVYDFYGAILDKMGSKGKLFDSMVNNPRHLLWRSVNKKLEKNCFTNWLLGQGRAIFENVHTPCEYFNYIKQFNTKEISPMITQDVLVLAGADDLYTIFYDEQIKVLTNARSVTGRLFTSEENASHHCQVGNIPLLLRTMTEWIDEKSDKEG